MTVPLKRKGNTKIFKYRGLYNDETEIIYHNTMIVNFNEKRIILNTGGFHTVSTKSRMNQVSKEFNLGFYIFQKKGFWKIKTSDGIFPFENNMEIRQIR